MIHDGQGVKVPPACGMLGRNLHWLMLKPAGALKLALRLPIYLYRLNLGWLLGHRFLLFAHLRRKSGLLRDTVLEVILYMTRLPGRAWYSPPGARRPTGTAT
jgi:hypothetical protein